MAGRPTNESANYFAIAKQSAKDTEGATFTFLRHLDGTALELEEQVESVREGGDGAEVGLRYKTAINMDGQAVVNERPEIGARLAAWAFGSDTTSAPAGLATTASGVCNEHLSVPSHTNAAYLTLEQYFADEIERVTNGQVSKLTLEFEQGRPLKITPEFMGGGSAYRRDVASALTPTRETGQPFMYPGASIVVDGVGSYAKITKGKITFTHNLDGDIRTTGLNREDVVALTIDTDVEFTAKYEDKGYYDKAHYGGGSQVPFDLATSSLKLYTTFGSGTNIRYQEWGVNQFHITGARVNKLDPDGKTMYLDVAGMGYKAATNQVYCRTLCASAAAFA